MRELCQKDAKTGRRERCAGDIEVTNVWVGKEQSCVAADEQRAHRPDRVIGDILAACMASCASSQMDGSRPARAIAEAAVL